MDWYRYRSKAVKFEAPGEDEEAALEAELSPLASEKLRFVNTCPFA